MENKLEIKKPNIQHAANIEPTSKEINPKKVSREELDRHIKNMRDRDAELITGVFNNLEHRATPSNGRGCVAFGFKKYPGEELEFYELCDGERYTLPRGVVSHLNNNCYFKEYQRMEGEFGSMGIRQGMADPRLAAKDGKLQRNNSHMQMAKKVHRFSFHNLEFMDDESDFRPSNLIEVTLTP